MDDGTLHGYLDGELPAEQAAAVEEHLATCADCRSLMDRARATRTRAHEILRYADPGDIVPPDFSTLLARRPAPAAVPERRFRRPSVLLPWAASVILALGAGWFAQDLLRGGEAGGGSLERVATADRERSAPPLSAEAGAARTAAPTEPESMASLSVTDAATATAPVPDRGAAATGASGTGAGEPSAAEPQPRLSAAAPPRQESAAADLARAEAADHPGVDPVVQLSTDVTVGEVRMNDEDGVEGERRMAGARSPTPPRPAPDWRPLPLDEDGWPVAWTTVDRDAATRALGEPPRVVPTLRVTAYQLSAAMPGAVRVVQRLPGGEALEILQRRRSEPSGAPVIAEATAARSLGAEAAEVAEVERAEAKALSLTLLRGDLDLWMRGQVPPDSLRRLGESIP